MKGIWFGDYHSYYDFNLILSQVNIPPAEPKITMIDIPGGDGSVDLTEALGDVKYKDRNCKFTFSVLPTDDFEEKKREVSGLLNGLRCKITVDKDPDYYWIGRCSVDEYASDRNLHKIVIKAIVSPYKWKQEVTKVFVPGGEGVHAVLYNGRKPTAPTISTNDNTIISNGKGFIHEFEVDGDHILPEFKLVFGENEVWVTSVWGATFTYQECDL